MVLLRQSIPKYHLYLNRVSKSGPGQDPKDSGQIHGVSEMCCPPDPFVVPNPTLVFTSLISSSKGSGISTSFHQFHRVLGKSYKVSLPRLFLWKWTLFGRTQLFL